MHLFDDLINFIFPSKCRTCGKLLPTLAEKYICNECFSKINRVSPPYCDKCGKMLVESFNEIEKPLCEECQIHKKHFLKARIMGVYEGILRESIHIFKFEKKICMQKPLSELLVNYLKEQQGDLISQIDFIIPVPLHRKRFRVRGFNQAQLLAFHIGRYFNLPLNLDLKRIRFTTPQMNLEREQRIQNIKGAFAVKNQNIITNKHLLLVDDIFTTGATVNECSKVLMKAGAKQVFVLTLARGR
ncbi:MAG: ComF family protein [bacterium]